MLMGYGNNDHMEHCFKRQHAADFPDSNLKINSNTHLKYVGHVSSKEKRSWEKI
jgi:hypothetical protein